mgnify:CR=1 FL=1
MEQGITQAVSETEEEEGASRVAVSHLVWFFLAFVR